MSGFKPSWVDDLERDGYVVVKNLVSKPVCDEFQDRALGWLESFPYGFKRDDRSTWNEQHLPYGFSGGLYNRYVVNHEDFVWKIRTQPGIIDAFAQLWGTSDLIASFDGINVSLPINAETGRTDIQKTAAWPHIDSDPRKVGVKEMIQGIVSLGENGPSDGGLVVMSRSHKLHQQFYDEHGGIDPKKDAGVGNNGYQYTTDDNEWFKAHGCEQVKVCAGPGDLILWDSRTIHWNCSPEGTQTRFAAYVCYCPRSMATEADLARKMEVFESRKGTTHWPNQNVIPTDKGNYGSVPRRPDGTPDPANRTQPLSRLEVTPAVLQLVGART